MGRPFRGLKYDKMKVGSATMTVLAVVCALFVIHCDGSASGSSRPDELTEPPGKSTPVTSAPEREAWKSQRAEFEAMADRLENSNNPFIGWAFLDTLRRNLANPGLTDEQKLRLHMQIVLPLLQSGDVDEAIEHADIALSMFDTTKPSKMLANMYQLRGLAHLRKAEVQNCVRQHNCDSCIFPLRGGGIHSVREPALKARDDYLEVLEIHPGAMRVLWLLNIVYMFLGEYPDGVPEPHRIPPSAFASDHDIGRFLDIAPQLKIDTFNRCGGAILEDFDNDGFLDIVTSTLDPRGPVHLFRNLGGGGFEDLSSKSRLNDQLGGLNCIAADHDNDGRRDVLVLRGAWLHDDGQIRNSLLKNEEDGTFTDVTRRAGLASPPRPTQAAAWSDFDNDGDLDLYIANESRPPWKEGRGNYPSQLFKNNGDGTFVDVAAAAGVTNDRFGKGVTAGDYDNDGDMDLYVSNIGVNRLYRNNGDFTFTDVAAEAGVAEPVGRSFAPWFFDYDNDGWLDLFVGAYEASIADLAAEAMGLPHKAKKARLYQNKRDGTFADVTDRTGVDGVYLPMGANFGDLDNDGFLDIYLSTGEPDYQALMPNVMLRNDGGKRFQDVTQSGGFGHLQKGHGVAFGDVDNDGDQDIYHQLGGFYPGDKFRNALFHNPGHENRFITIVLVGTRSNRDAIGARVRVVVEDQGGTREIHRAVGSVSSFGGSPLRQEIGLGAARAIRTIEVSWPMSGLRSTIENVPLNGMIRIEEGVDGYEALELRKIDLLADSPNGKG